MMLLKMFQFQIGPIGSAMTVCLSKKVNQFQFQIGPIGSVINFFLKLKMRQFQFQIGPIGSLLEARIISCLLVSIPDWSDWQLKANHLNVPGICFNSRLVRLAAVPAKTSLKPNSSFNSRLVRLAVPVMMFSSETSSVSIPDWSDWQPEK